VPLTVVRNLRPAQLSSIQVSVVDHTPQELILLSVDGLNLEYSMGLGVANTMSYLYLKVAVALLPHNPVERALLQLRPTVLCDVSIANGQVGGMDYTFVGEGLSGGQHAALHSVSCLCGTGHGERYGPALPLSHHAPTLIPPSSSSNDKVAFSVLVFQSLRLICILRVLNVRIHLSCPM
jgi:hypothetical protein